MKEYFIAFGGNIADVEQNFIKAAKLIEKEIGEIFLKSSLYKSKALTLDVSVLDPNKKQDDYLNCVICLKTRKNEKEVLHKLNDIEAKLGRLRIKKWDSRVIDLDIIAVGNLVLETKELTIPHKEMHKRTFVLKPLNEIAPSWRHPILNKTANEFLAEFELAGFNLAVSNSDFETPCRILKSFPDYES